METVSYIERRGQLETYFDRTAADAWSRLTSDAPVSRIRATVREGRDRMRGTLLSWLPDDMRGMRLLDAGCGTGMLALEAAKRGAEVTAIDLSPTLVGLARDRLPGNLKVDFRVGDMLDPALGRFDHIVSMDSLIHYKAADMVRALELLTDRTGSSVVFTFAPSTKALMVMHAVGKLFPRGNRAPAIEPVREASLRHLLTGLDGWKASRSERIACGFYTSQALELVPHG
ncbi:magnesium-protoporphyrin O-methyltransferase [Skermanella aerolata]|uniref:Magnesium protoporphyrin IX methyltransferase n=1 Tax=Skermanella aerolata TaxID=393310 RepID=A0A512DSH1_9PROT|nr:magnesium protoporphyrin IX methyltransferase [Skermanella aerolata]KJB96111.1 SAM-dependent methlyltransferase [Skermanella aerolata KACC 11604]GEO39431.1 magnesium protoporphyrin IX methyltransferase [Skermanella aerolata]